LTDSDSCVVSASAADRRRGEVSRLSVGVAFHSPFYTPLFVTNALGYFKDEGFETTISTPPPGKTVDMLEDGSADLILGGVMRTFILAERGGPRMIAIAEVNSRDGFFILSRTPAPNFSWNDLEGKRLALFGLAPTPWMCLQTAMREQGADPAKVHVQEKLDVGQGIEALTSGRAEYLQTGQPVVDQLIRDGVAHLASAQAPIVKHVPYSSFIVTDETRMKRPELCAAVVRALTRGFAWIRANDGDAIAGALAPAFPDVPHALMALAVSRLKAQGIWSDGPQQDRAAFDRLGSMLVNGGLIKRAASYDDLNDDRFAQQAVAGKARR
jgi:NitT/TauT family transport system substrate-binding protein